MKYAEHILDLVGNTPLVKLNSVTDGIAATVLGKVEYLNPGGSVKDRIALAMVEAAEASGALKPGGVIVEPTSGNTGVGLALVAQRKGYSCIFVCPDKVSEDKRNVLKAYGAQVVVCPTSVPPEHPDSYYSTSDRLVRETPGAWKPDQYSKPNGPLSHYASTRPEIWADPDRPINHLAPRAGTGRTISGAGSAQPGGAARTLSSPPVGAALVGCTIWPRWKPSPAKWGRHADRPHHQQHRARASAAIRCLPLRPWSRPRDPRETFVRAWDSRPFAFQGQSAVSYTHLRAHETVLDLVCRLLLDTKNSVT